MFERFTDKARRVVVLAQEEARRLNHPYIGTEHVLLGLIIGPGGVAFQALASQGIDATAVRQSVVQIMGEGTEAPPSHIPFTPRAKKVLELSLRESLQLGHSYIGSEHILLGLVREGEGVAAQVLARLGVNLDDLRASVKGLVGLNPESGEPSSTRRWPGGLGQGRGMCRHTPASLSIEVQDISNTDKGTTSVSLIICTACGTTIGVLPG